MKEDNRIPVLVKVQSEIEYGFRNFTEPDFIKCENCGGNLFYIGTVYGILYDRYNLQTKTKVLGETEESKYYRKFDIREISEERYCAVCGLSAGLVSVWDREDIVKNFEDKWDMEYYEKALSVLQYPPKTERKKIINENSIKEVKKWIEDWEKKRKERK